MTDFTQIIDGLQATSDQLSAILPKSAGLAISGGNTVIDMVLRNKQVG